jgi:hypothetical protein
MNYSNISSDLEEFKPLSYSYGKNKFIYGYGYLFEDGEGYGYGEGHSSILEEGEGERFFSRDEQCKKHDVDPPPPAYVRGWVGGGG